jgi:hypothetical protein
LPSTTNLDFYLARAAQARDEADSATLDHVRERCRRSEAAWTALADRAARSEDLKAKHEKLKAAEAAELKKHEQYCQDRAQERALDPHPSGEV